MDESSAIKKLRAFRIVNQLRAAKYAALARKLRDAGETERAIVWQQIAANYQFQGWAAE